MRDDEAQVLVTALVAAFPWPTVPEATAVFYRTELRGLSDVEAAAEAVQGLARSGKRLPPLSDVLDAYRVIVRRKQEAFANERGLEELPDVEPSRENALAVLRGLPDEGGPLTEQIRAHFESVAGIGSSGNGEAIAEEELELNPGLCDDCHHEAPHRRDFHGRRLCRRCFEDRQRVARELEENSTEGGEKR